MIFEVLIGRPHVSEIKDSLLAVVCEVSCKTALHDSYPIGIYHPGPLVYVT